jgi:hypothetical protein
MIREVEPLAMAAGMHTTRLAAAPAAPAEAVEREINRLTWSVLDGSASPADRGRLAELVRTQHATRPRAAS